MNTYNITDISLNLYITFYQVVLLPLFQPFVPPIDKCILAYTSQRGASIHKTPSSLLLYYITLKDRRTKMRKKRGGMDLKGGGGGLGFKD